MQSNYFIGLTVPIIICFNVDNTYYTCYYKTALRGVRYENIRDEEIAQKEWLPFCQGTYQPRRMVFANYKEQLYHTKTQFTGAEDRLGECNQKAGGN